MADLRLRISILEKNERGQEVELVRKTIQFHPQVSTTYLHILDVLWALDSTQVAVRFLVSPMLSFLGFRSSVKAF